LIKERRPNVLERRRRTRHGKDQMEKTRLKGPRLEKDQA
jgi:hypothetical protein